MVDCRNQFQLAIFCGDGSGNFFNSASILPDAAVLLSAFSAVTLGQASGNVLRLACRLLYRFKHS